VLLVRVAGLGFGMWLGATNTCLWALGPPWPLLD
jgi:hypothetical protein